MASPPCKMGLSFLLAAAGPPNAAAAVAAAEAAAAPPPPPAPPPAPPPPPPPRALPVLPPLASAGLSDGGRSALSPGGLVTPLPRHTCACGASFNRSLHYLHHISNAASAACDTPDAPLYLCEVPGCESAFRRKTDRAKHISCVHSKLRPFKCEAPGCDSAFFFSKDMRKHFATVREFSPVAPGSLTPAVLASPSSSR
jgi:hypothetical protein